MLVNAKELLSGSPTLPMRKGKRPNPVKGATYYGIGSAVARLAEVLLYDQRAVLTICSRIQGLPGCEGVTLGLHRRS